MNKIIIGLIFLAVFVGNSFAGNYVDKLLKEKIITQEQINKGVTIKGEKGDTKIIRKGGKIYIEHRSKKKIQKRKERELRKKIKDNEDRYNELKKELEKLKRRGK